MVTSQAVFTWRLMISLLRLKIVDESKFPPGVVFLIQKKMNKTGEMSQM